MPCLAKMAEKMSIDDKQIFGITMLKLQALSLESSGNDSRGHCCESQLVDGEDEHPDCYIIIRIYLRREFRSLRSDSYTICDSKHYLLTR